jgi:hypothetical protein
MRFRDPDGAAGRGERLLRLAVGAALATVIVFSTSAALADATVSGARISGQYVVVYRLARHSVTVRVPGRVDAVTWSIKAGCDSGSCGFGVTSRREGRTAAEGAQQWRFGGPTKSGDDSYVRDAELNAKQTGYDCHGVSSNERLAANDATSTIHAELHATVESTGGRVLRFDGRFYQFFKVTDGGRRVGCADGWEVWNFTGYAIR